MVPSFFNAYFFNTSSLYVFIEYIDRPENKRFSQ